VSGIVPCGRCVYFLQDNIPAVEPGSGHGDCRRRAPIEHGKYSDNWPRVYGGDEFLGDGCGDGEALEHD